ncbi:hypothetical protein EVAR_41627_1 [Eumeta japonica]|uniref:Uncharacterized protein n=1 Tax=Eumeta variegata TaxID=151549 RepID=A0A4C1WZH2_EUMVA|nr:hypothetical protein EVAR_41627_1 [Eumeta japonica]
MAVKDKQERAMLSYGGILMTRLSKMLRSAAYAFKRVRLLTDLWRQLTKAAAPKCPITDRSGVCCYDAKARAEMIAEYIAEQFVPNPPATSPILQKCYAQVENRVRKFMDTVPPPSRRSIRNPSHTTQNSDASPQK